jgi:SWI/SNF-related matrix-associated actin-dependent regulator 1 of chromatin subfamily A
MNTKPRSGKNLAELSRAVSSDFKVPTPEGLALFPYQKAGVEFLTHAQHALLADPPGVGKTIQVIGFMNYMHAWQALVLCPASLCFNWQRELNKWCTAKIRAEIYKPKTFDPNNPPHVLIFSYAYASRMQDVKRVLQGFRYHYLVIDECHFLKEPKSKRTKYVLAKNGLVSKAHRVHALSGTPIVNRPIELFPIVKSLCPDAIDNMSYFEYGLTYCQGFKGEWGWDFSGASNLKFLGARLRQRFMIRRPKTEILKELPEKFPPNIVYLNDDPKTRALVKKMKVFDEHAVLKRGNSPAFEELSTLRRELGEAKVEASAEYIKTQLQAGHEKIIVFAHHKAVVKHLAEALAEFHPVVLAGDTATNDRQVAIDRFQGDKSVRVFVGSITAAGVGITLTASSYVVFVECSWVPGENEQAIDRAHRIGQAECVMIDFLVHEGSLDERILKVLMDKSKVIKEVYSA